MSDPDKKTIVRIETEHGCAHLYLNLTTHYSYKDIRLEINSPFIDPDKGVAQLPVTKTELAALASAIQEFLR